jgi:type II secretory pathway pseudopilin PulG
MRYQNKIQSRRLAGFNRTELMIVLAVVAVLVTVLFLGLGLNKENRRRAECRANLQQIGVALQLYTKDFGELLPDCTDRNPEFHGAVWPWDMNTNLVTQLENRGAERDILYCPSNPEMNDDRHWDFPEFSGGRTRVLGYIFLLPGYRDVPPELARLKLNGAGPRKPDDVELTADATVSQNGDYTHIRGLLTDRTSHLSGQNPAGGNILFEDGHAAWRPFSQMKHQIVAQEVWDF